MTSRQVVRGLGIAAALVLVVGVLVITLGGGNGVPAAGARVTVDGTASVVRLDGSTEPLSTGDIVRAGEEVHAVEGTFGLELAAGGTLEGRAGFGRAPDTKVVVGARPELVAGEVLLLGEDGLDVDAAGTVIALTGPDAAARVDRGLAVRAGAYRGGLALDSAGQERSVAALRQLGIASLGRPPGSAEPFLVDAADPWDRRFLGGAIDLSDRLDGYSRTFSGEAGAGAARSVELFEAALPAVADERSFPAALRSVSDQLPGEILIGAAIASLGERGDFIDRWDDVFGFREDGADWGLVAVDQGLDDATVLSTVEAAITRARPTPEVAAGPTPSDDEPGTGGPGGPGGTTPTTTTPTTAPPRTGGGPPGTTTPTTTPTVPTPTLPGPTPTLPVPPPTLPGPQPTVPPVTVPPPPDTGVGPADDILDGVTDLVEDTSNDLGETLNCVLDPSC